MDYSDRGRKPKETYKENTKPQLVSRGVEFFKYPTARAFSMTSMPHTHSAIEILYLVKGSLLLYHDEGESRIGEGDLVLFRSQCLHSIYTEECDENDYYVLKIEPRILYSITPPALGESFPLRFTSYFREAKTIWRRDEIRGTSIELGLRRLTEELLAGDEGLSDLKAVLSALLVLEGLYESSEESTARAANGETMSAAIVYVGVHLDEPLTERSVADKFGISYSHFCREFRRVTGATFREHLTELRIALAERLLADPSLSVAEVAEKCGYGSASHFIQVYKRLHGVTPLQSRRS